MTSIRNIVLAVLLCVAPSTLLSNQGEIGGALSDAQVQLVIEGADGNLIPVAADAKLRSVGWVSVESEAANIRVSASDVNREPVKVVQVEQSLFAVLGSGKVWVEIDCVDFDKKIFEKEQYTLEIPDAPKPDDPSREWKSDSAREADGVLHDLGSYYAEVFRETANRVADGRISSDRELADFMIPANKSARSRSRSSFDRAFEAAMPNGKIDDQQAVAELLREIAEAFDNG